MLSLHALRIITAVLLPAVAGRQTFDEFLKSRKLCVDASATSLLCDPATSTFFDQSGIDPDEAMTFVCLPWLNKQATDLLDLACSDADKARARAYAEKTIRKIACGNMGDLECQAKFSAPKLGEYFRCSVGGQCMGPAAADTAKTTVAEVGTASTAAAGARQAASEAMRAQVTAAAEAARTTAVEAANAAGKNAAQIGQIGRHAAEAAAKESAASFGFEVTRMTAKGGAELVSNSASQVAAQGATEVAKTAAAEGTKTATAEAAKTVAAEGAKTWTAVGLDMLGPGIGGAFNAGFEVWENGWSPKAASKFATGAAGSAAGTAFAAAACTFGGPVTMIGCAAVGSMVTTRMLDTGMDSLVFSSDPLTAEEEELVKGALEDAKSKAPKAALTLAMVASGQLRTQSELQATYWMTTPKAIAAILDTQKQLVIAP